MSSLKFQSHCGFCYAAIAQGSGVVLSCGDFLCHNCKNLDRETCPICCTAGVLVANLSNPPEEVHSKMLDAAIHLQGIFTVMEFQVSHYKETLSRASQKIIALRKAKAEDKRYLHFIL